MQTSVTTIIDRDLCNGCGLCVKVCPANTISIQDGKAVVTGTYSMVCGHCEAVCPLGAIRVTALESPFSLATVEVDNRWLPFGKNDTGQLVRLMRSRRSCRNYSSKEIDRVFLEDLVKVGTTAPSGTNSQLWTFTILAKRREVKVVGEQVAYFFKKLNRLAEKPWARFFSKIFGNDALGRYYHQHYLTVQRGIELWEKDDKDTLFHGATAAILVGAETGASCPAEDALLASQNILLAAHSMGLGSCMIGFAVEAINRDQKIKNLLGIPPAETVYSVIALGYAAEKYQRPALRKKITPRYPEL
jgi:nitroreductase/NAD-dependent dihydropyrimidine dehydrogenase PreA subunit